MELEVAGIKNCESFTNILWRLIIPATFSHNNLSLELKATRADLKRRDPYSTLDDKFLETDHIFLHGENHSLLEISKSSNVQNSNSNL